MLLNPANGLRFLKLRQNIHQNQSIRDILFGGKKRFSQFGVQLLFVFKKNTPEGEQYLIRIMQRSGETAIRKGYWQFIPSGGFESFESEPDPIDLKNDFNVYKALLREFLEEIYNVKDLERFNKNKKSSDDLIFGDEKIKELENLIEQNRAHFLFLGSVFDLVVLRHELSFLLIIEDKLFAQKDMIDSDEGIGRSRSVNAIIEMFFDKHKINPGSAGLFKLAMNTDIFKTKILNGIPIKNL